MVAVVFGVIGTAESRLTNEQIQVRLQKNMAEIAQKVQWVKNNQLGSGVEAKPSIDEVEKILLDRLTNNHGAKDFTNVKKLEQSNENWLVMDQLADDFVAEVENKHASANIDLNQKVTAAYEASKNRYNNLAALMRSNRGEVINDVFIYAKDLNVIEIIKDCINPKPDANSMTPSNIFTATEAKEEKAELEEYPVKSQQLSKFDSKDVTYTFGDMHGNVLKLINFLMMVGIIEMTQETYNKIVELYGKCSSTVVVFNNRYLKKASAEIEVAKQTVKEFKTLLESGEIKFNNKASVRLLGDIIADRGNNDYLILLLLGAMKKAEVKFEIVASNHDVEIIKLLDLNKENLQNVTESLQAFDVNIGQANSALCALETVTWNEYKQALKELYLPHFKLLSYEISKDKQSMTIFMHGVNNCYVIEGLVKQMEIKNFKTDTAETLASAIDSINDRFCSKLRSADDEDVKWACNVLENSYFQGSYGKEAVARELPGANGSALGALIWSRSCGNDTGYAFVTFIVHGHDCEYSNWEQYDSKRTNLDTDIGKLYSTTKGNFRVFVTTHELK